MNQKIQAVRAIFERYAAFCDVGEPVSDRIIAAAERHLQVRFPASYRDFLATMGYANFYGLTIAGLYSTGILDNVRASEARRGRPMPAGWARTVVDENGPFELGGTLLMTNDEIRSIEQLPAGSLIVMPEDEFYSMIATGEMHDDEAPVYEVELGYGKTPSAWKLVAPDFGTCLLGKVEEWIEWLRADGKIK